MYNDEYMYKKCNMKKEQRNWTAYFITQWSIYIYILNIFIVTDNFCSLWIGGQQYTYMHLCHGYEEKRQTIFPR